MIVGMLDRFIGGIKREYLGQLFNENYMEYRRVVREQKEGKALDNEWIKIHLELNKDLIESAVKDEEGEEMTIKLNEVFTKLDKKMKGEFSKKYDWYVERDQRGKLHLHVFEI